MGSIDWLSLPEFFWIDVFDHLDVKSLLTVTESCQTFAQVFNSSIKLNRKVKVVINPESIDALKSSKRNYRNAIIRSSDNEFKEMSAIELSKLQKVFSQLEEITSKTEMRNHCLSFIQEAVNLRKIDLRNAYVETASDSFKGFLMNQKDLKDLRFRIIHPDLFKVIPANPPFQLENLVIPINSQDSIVDVLAFLSGQRSFRSIELIFSKWPQTSNPRWIRETLDQIMLQVNLKTVIIQYMEREMEGDTGLEFLQLPANNMVCPSVVNLEYVNISSYGFNIDLIDSVFMEFCVKVFPNVQKFFCCALESATDLMLISSWHRLVSLELRAEHELLKELEVKSEKFKTFKLTMYNCYNSKRFLNNLGQFLKRHPTIRHLTLKLEGPNHGSESFPNQIDQVIAESIPELETLSISKFVKSY